MRKSAFTGFSDSVGAHLNKLLDGLHLTEAGYKIVGEILKDKIGERLNSL